MLRRLLLLSILCLPTAPALAEPAMEAVGRLNFAGYRAARHCTAFLVGAQTAATAAHCLEGLRATDLHLLLGYDKGPWREHLRPGSAETAGRGADLALLCLPQAALTTPFPWSEAAPEPGEELIVQGYGRPRIHAQTRRACPVLTASAGRVILDCPVAPGTSGAPVLRRTDSGYEAVAVVSASQGRTAIAVRPSRAIRRVSCGG